MAVEMFLKLDGVDGDSADPTHKNEIEIRSFHWDVSNPATGFPPPLAAATTQPSVEDFSLRSVAGTATPVLLRRCFTGEHIKEGVLTVRRAGGSAPAYLEYQFEDILVTRIEQGGESTDPASDALVTFSLNFSKVTVLSYPEVAERGAGQPVAFRWDFAGDAVTSVTSPRPARSIV